MKAKIGIYQHRYTRYVNGERLPFATTIWEIYVPYGGWESHPETKKKIEQALNVEIADIPRPHLFFDADDVIAWIELNGCIPIHWNDIVRLCRKKCVYL